MTAEKATAQEATRKVAFAKVLAIQIIAYVVLVALALVPGMMYGDAAKPAAVPFTIIASLAMVVLLVVFSPFRDGVAGHVIAAIAGLLSAICATTVMLGNVIFPAGLDGGKSFSMEEAWIAGVGGLLIVLIIVSFGRQMRNLSTDKKYEQIRGWLLQAVLGAEREFGSGTGKLKLSSVYDKFCERFPWLAKVLPFETFSKYVDDALSEMKDVLKQNSAIASIVEPKEGEK